MQPEPRRAAKSEGRKITTAHAVTVTGAGQRKKLPTTRAEKVDQQNNSKHKISGQ